MQSIEALEAGFRAVAKIACLDVSDSALSVEILTKPHKAPKRLSDGKMAVYVFQWNDTCLKVGKVGTKSSLRYTSQHYNPKGAQGTLARSLLSRKGELGLAEITEENVGNWIKRETDRYNFLLDAELGPISLSLLESFLQCRLLPVFEGFESQK